MSTTATAPDCRTGRVHTVDVLPPDWTAPEPVESAARANLRVAQIVDRCKRGRLAPGNALAQLEAYAPALDVAVYDAAVDAVFDAALVADDDMSTTPHRVARTRARNQDGLDADTRRARKRARKGHRPTVGKGRHGAHGVENNVAERVTLARPWRGEVTGRPTASAVRVTQVVWAPGAYAAFLPGMFPTVKRRRPHRDGSADTFYGHRVQPGTGRVDTGMRVLPVQSHGDQDTRDRAVDTERAELLARLAREQLEASSVPLAH